MKAWFAVLVLAIPLFARANGLPDEPFRTPPDERFLVSANPYYHQPERAIKNRVAYFKKQDGTNHFCLRHGYQYNLACVAHRTVYPRANYHCFGVSTSQYP